MVRLRPSKEPLDPLLALARAAQTGELIDSHLLEAALRTARAVDPTDAASVESALVALMQTYDAGPEWDVGERLIKEAMRLAVACFGETGQERFVQGLARQLRDRGMIDAALQLLAFALRLDVAVRADRDPDVVSTLLNLTGELYRESGRPNDAERHYKAALDELPPEDAFDHARGVILNNLGLACSARGDLDEALRYLLESLRIAEKVAADPHSIALTLDNLGAVESNLARAAGPLWIADGYINEVVDRHLRYATDYFDRAGELFEAGLPGTRNDYAVHLLNYAGAVEQQGDQPRLDDLTERAVAAGAASGVPSAIRFEIVTIRGEVLLRKGEPERALRLLTSWFEKLLPRMEPHERISRGYAAALRAASAIGEQDLVDEIARSLIENDSQILPRMLAGGSTQETRAAFGVFRSRAALILGHCLPTGKDGVAPDWLYEVVLNSKGILAEREGSAWLRAHRADGASSELFERVRALRAEAAGVDLDGSEVAAISIARRRHAEAERRLRQAEVELQRELEPAGAALPHVTLDEFQARLPADSLVLDVVSVEARDDAYRYVAFLVGPTGDVHYQDLGEVEGSEERLRALIRELAVRPESADDPVQRATRIRELMPVVFDGQGALPERLLVAPTGSWGLIPFGLLPDASGRPLIDSHVVSMLSSARSLIQPSSDGASDLPPAGPPVVLGDPDFDLDLPDDLPYFLSVRLDRLPHSAAEVEDVAAILGVEAFADADATRKRLLQLRRPRLLHLACHGVFLDAVASLAEQSEPTAFVMRAVAGVVVREEVSESELMFRRADSGTDDPATLHRNRVAWLRDIGPRGQLSRSALLLAGVNAWLAGVPTRGEVGTGMLSAGEFALLDLAGTELVVLSACETGVGAVDAADGSLLGLRTAALAAGAAGCVSTLWNVEDDAARAAMSALYRELRKGDDPARALRTAQLHLRSTHPDPYFWAGWVVEGGLEPIRLP